VGHATIFPHPKFTDLFKVVKNPTTEFVAEAIEVSEKRTYPKIGLIKANYEVERDLNRCLNLLIEENEHLTATLLNHFIPKDKSFVD